MLNQHEALDFVLIDCEKEDYVRFWRMLRLAPGAIIVADSILSHGLWNYVEEVRHCPGVESITLPLGRGLEVSRYPLTQPPRARP